MLVHRPENPPKPPSASDLNFMLGQIYTDENNGITDSVVETSHREHNESEKWYIHRGITGSIYLVPQMRAKDQEEARDLVRRLSNAPRGGRQLQKQS